MNKTATVVAAVGLCLSAWGVAAPASAESDVFRDARADMGDGTRGADIHRVRVVHTSERLLVRVVHADLRRSFRSSSSLSVFVDTDRSRRGPELVLGGGTFSGTDYALHRAQGWKPRNHRGLPCPHRMRLDFQQEVARVSLSRGCLGATGAVRVAVRTAADADGGTRDWLGSRREWTPALAQD